MHWLLWQAAGFLHNFIIFTLKWLGMHQIFGSWKFSQKSGQQIWAEAMLCCTAQKCSVRWFHSSHSHFAVCFKGGLHCWLACTYTMVKLQSSSLFNYSTIFLLCTHILVHDSHMLTGKWHFYVVHLFLLLAVVLLCWHGNTAKMAPLNLFPVNKIIINLFSLCGFFFESV